MSFRSSHLLYLGLLVARILLAATSSTYIHPDEFFQAPEIAAQDILHIEGTRTWEFDPQLPIRSIVPIYLFAGIPLFVSKHLLSPMSIFATNRAFMAILSLVVDISVYQAIRRLHPTAKLSYTMILLASSHCLVVFHVHTFANSFASVLLALCFNLLSYMEVGSKEPRRGLMVPAMLLGSLMSLGTFTHISFPMFALPIAITTLWILLKKSSRHLANLLSLAMGGLLAILGLVVVDSIYYGHLSINGLTYRGTLTCTVLNNLRYNSQHQNLAQHGIHPRYLHSVINMPQIFGPLYLLMLYHLWTLKQTKSLTSMTAALSSLSGLLILSLVPHQEARFLVPALTGMVIGTWRWHRLLPQWFWTAWTLFNLTSTAVFGGVHQRGVVPMMEYLSSTSVMPSMACQPLTTDHVSCRPSTKYTGEQLVLTKVLLVSTYMAPKHLLNQQSNYQGKVDLKDLVGMEDSDIANTIANSAMASCSVANTERVFRRIDDGIYERTWVVAPGSVNMTNLSKGRFEWQEIVSFGEHVNFDHLGEVMRNPMNGSRLILYSTCRRMLVGALNY